MRYNSIRPGQIWLDTSGKPIQAHGFSVFYSEQDQTYYGKPVLWDVEYDP